MIYSYFIALFCSPYWHTVPSSAISLPCGDIGGFGFKLLYSPWKMWSRGEELLVGTLTTKSRLTTRKHFIVCSTLLEEKVGAFFSDQGVKRVGTGQ